MVAEGEGRLEVLVLKQNKERSRYITERTDELGIGMWFPRVAKVEIFGSTAY